MHIQIQPYVKILLTVEEIQILAELLDSVSGPPNTKGRRFTSSLREKLDPLVVKGEKIDNYFTDVVVAIK